MKIIMIGALRYSNFGDILFAKLFYQRLRETHPNCTVLLYETKLNPVSQFCREELQYFDHFKLKDLKDAEAIVYISGGYFANDFEDTLTKVLWHIRYALPGVYFSKRKKDIYVIGVGGGEFSWGISSDLARKILNAAKYISVRNVETKEKFINLGVTNDIQVLSDTAQIVKKIYGVFDSNVQNQSDSIFLHILPNDTYYDLLKEKVFPAIKRYLEGNGTLRLLIGYDSKVKKTYYSYIDRAIQYFGPEVAERFEYKSVDGMIDTLRSCRTIITPKLHVGIISASFNKPVISFPINYEKTGRYYRSIGYAERCVSIKDLDKETAFQMLINYSNSPIIICDKIVEMAEENLAICSQIGLQGES